MSNKSEHLGGTSLTCVIIGSGIAGIASAIRLANRGHQVDVYEARPEPGGKLSELHAAGYRFDLGPTVLTLPELIDELFTLCGRQPADYFQYEKLEQPFNYFFEDGTVITAHADINKYADELEQKTSDDHEALTKYLNHVAKKYDILNEVFIENSLHQLSNFLTSKAFAGMLNFHQIDLFKSINDGNKKYFNDPKTIQIFNKCANYVGSNPFVAPGTLNVIQHLEVNLGVYFPKGGMYQIVRGLVKLAEELGVTFHYHQLVEQILIENKSAVGIRTENEGKQFYDRVISNMDVFHTYRRLMPNQPEPKISLKQDKSNSCFAFYWGINTTFDQLKVHNMLFTSDEKLENDIIIDGNSVSDDPSIYICVTSKVNPSDALDGCENWFVMISAPNNQGQDWESIKQVVRINIIKKINRLLHTDIESHIESEHIMTPSTIERRYLSLFGAPYGTSSNKRLAAFLRHPNFSSKIKNLYFSGGSVHPGAGVPMSLNSAKIMDKMFK